MEIMDLIGTNNVWAVVMLDLIDGRTSPIFSPINDKDLVIMGGALSKNDAFLFSVKK